MPDSQSIPAAYSSVAAAHPSLVLFSTKIPFRLQFASLDALTSILLDSCPESDVPQYLQDSPLFEQPPNVFRFFVQAACFKLDVVNAAGVGEALSDALSSVCQKDRGVV